MIARRFTRARLGLWLAVIAIAGFLNEAVAGQITSAAAANSWSRPAWRLAFNASAHRSSPDASLPAAPSSLAEIKIAGDLREAAEAGDTHAQLDLGFRYESGRGVSQDAAQAIAWFRKAAEQGFDEAQYTLGCCYNGDDGFPKDSAEAVSWWKKAAAQNHADAQYCLGLSYSTGEGVARNPAEAAKWWKKAAEQDHANAQYFLGLSYSAGLGVPKIPEQAIYWLRKAANNGSENAVAALKKLGQDSDLPARKQSAGRIRRGGNGPA